MNQQNLNLVFSVCIGLSLSSCDNSNKNNSVNSGLYVVDSSAPIKTAFFKMDTLDQIPDDLKTLIKGQINRVFQVDFNGDGKLDFICQYKPIKITVNADFLEDWITSDKQILKTEKKYSMDFDFYWFVNLDKDSEPEIFSATGYEDGMDNAFYDQDIQTGQDKLLFYFNPIIINNGKHYWGYPWDITDLILKIDSANIYLQSSVDLDIERDGNITVPDSTKQFPAIFFHGHSTQPEMKVAEIRNIKWATLDELK